MTRFDVCALGEVLIDFTYSGMSDGGNALFEQNPGGAPANVLTALSRLGCSCAFIGKVGRDMHGDFLEATLKAEGICTDALVHDADKFTTLAFVSLSPEGERSFSFARKPGADTCLTAEEVDTALISASRIFHFGSLSLTDEPAHSATLRALNAAKASGCVVSYDPNWRPLLWKSREVGCEKMRSVLNFVDLIKISDEECELITGHASPEAAAQALVSMGLSAVAVTLGENGALVANREGIAAVEALPCTVVDTTGAGDSFWGGFLHKFLASGKRPQELSLADIAGFARFGNAVASLCVEGRGAIPSMPTAEDVAARLDSAR